MKMILGSIARDVLLHTLNDWKEYINQNRSDSYTENLEKILLFHATFSNLFDESLQLKVHSIYEFFRSKLELQQDKKLLLFDYAPMVILEKIFSDYTEDQDVWFHKLFNLLSSKSSSARKFSAQLLVFYLHKNVDFKNEVLGVSLKDLLIQNAYHSIEAHYFDNIHLFALMRFLNLPKEEKTAMFEELLEYAREQDASQDIPLLEQFVQGSPNIPNPFYSYFAECQQATLQKLLNLQFNPEKTSVGIQLDIFNQASTPLFHYYFEDVRLQYFLPWVKFHETSLGF